jgi:hypothetical protein
MQPHWQPSKSLASMHALGWPECVTAFSLLSSKGERHGSTSWSASSRGSHALKNSAEGSKCVQLIIVARLKLSWNGGANEKTRESAKSHCLLGSAILLACEELAGGFDCLCTQLVSSWNAFTGKSERDCAWRLATESYKASNPKIAYLWIIALGKGVSFLLPFQVYLILKSPL